jgi:uncharacterized membrane protein
LTLFTRYPAQEIAAGESATFDLTLRSNRPQTVWLEAQNLPEGWTAVFRGGGRVIRAAYVEAESNTTVDLRLELPESVQADTYRFTVVARGEDEQAQLPIELTIKDKLPPRLTFDVDLPTLRGTRDTSFRFNVTLRNEGDEDLSVNLTANTPPEFLVTFRTGGQEVTSIPIGANESKQLSIEAQAFGEVPAGTYQFDIQAQGGDVQAATTLFAEVVGKAELRLAAPDGRLSAQVRAGEETPISLLLINNGSAPVYNVEMDATPPVGWEVKLEPEQIAEVAAGGQVEVTAKLRPAKQAIAGDYMVSFIARPEGAASKSAEFRITVRTSTLWGIVGVGLVAVAVIIVGLAVTRFGRR